jgi:hypothetical protein
MWMHIDRYAKSGAGAAREKDRNSFFESLRRKDSPVASLPDACEEAAPVPSGSALSAPQSPKAAAAAAASHAAGSSKPAEEQPQPLAHAPPWQPGTPHAPAPAEASGAARDAASHSSSNGGAWVPAMNGNGSSSSSADQAGPSAGRKAAKLVIPAEEEAFLRSLGWEACDDDEDEGAATCPAWRQVLLQAVDGPVLSCAVVEGAFVAIRRRADAGGDCGLPCKGTGCAPPAALWQACPIDERSLLSTPRLVCACCIKN